MTYLISATISNVTRSIFIVAKTQSSENKRHQAIFYVITLFISGSRIPVLARFSVPPRASSKPTQPSVQRVLDLHGNITIAAIRKEASSASLRMGCSYTSASAL